MIRTLSTLALLSAVSVVPAFAQSQASTQSTQASSTELYLSLEASQAISEAGISILNEVSIVPLAEISSLKASLEKSSDYAGYSMDTLEFTGAALPLREEVVIGAQALPQIDRVETVE